MDEDDSKVEFKNNWDLNFEKTMIGSKPLSNFRLDHPDSSLIKS